MKTKSTFLAIAILTIASTALHAQINKGSIALGGNLSFNTSKAKSETFEQKQTTLFISPSLITFYKDNRGLGFNLNYSHYEYNSTYKTNGYGAGIFLRQYKPLGSGFYVFVQEALNYNYTSGNTDSLSQPGYRDIKSNIVIFTANPGVAYDVSKKFQLELLFLNNLISASYNHTNYTYYNNETQKYDAFTLGANLDAAQFTYLNIGAKIFFGR